VVLLLGLGTACGVPMNAMTDSDPPGLAPEASADFAGVTATVTLTGPLVGTYKVTYDTASEYSIEGVTPWIADSSGTYTYTRTGPDDADLEFQDSDSGTVWCTVHYTTRMTGRSQCTYPNHVTLSSRFTVP